MWRFSKSKSSNTAVDQLRRHRGQSRAQVSEWIAVLPQMASALKQGRDYLYDRVVCTALRDYDIRAGSQIAHAMGAAQADALREELMAVLLFTFFQEQSKRDVEPSVAWLLTDALHYAVYDRPATAGEGVCAYRDDQNPHFEDPKIAYAFRFGQRIGQIMETLDLPFSLMMSQHAVCVAQVCKTLMDQVLPPVPPNVPGAPASKTSPQTSLGPGMQ